MPITIVPNENVSTAVGVPICFEATAIYSLPQQEDSCINLPASGTNWTFSFGACKWTKIGGSSTGVCDAEARTGETSDVFGRQPFYISALNLTFTTPPAPNRFYASFVGVTDIDVNGFFGWYIYKNCGNQSTTNCNATTTSNQAQNWKAFIIVNGVNVNPVPQGVNASEQFRVRSNGVTMFWDWQTAGQWNTLYQVPLPDVSGWTYYINSCYRLNEWYYIRTFKGTYQGSVPLTWTTPLGGVLTGTGSTRCFTSESVGTYQVCVDSEFDEPVCVDIDVAPLYINAVDYNCGTDCVFTGQIVEFESNGGEQGILEVVDISTSEPAGVVLGPLSWQAPNEPMNVMVTYTLEGNSAVCMLGVVEPLTLLNVVGNTITGLVPGDTLQILDNYTAAGGEIVWENLDCNGIVSETGFVTIPNNLNDPCFGKLDCYIRARVIAAPESTCENLENIYYIDVRIIVDPVYPTPEFGGPKPLKWKPETPDYRVITNQYEGGCAETYLRNRVPIHKWTVNYSGLSYENLSQCEPDECCDDTIGYVDGVHPRFQTASRLDAFWRLVAGISGYFTLVDYRTGQVWRKVRFEAEMQRDHINWYKTQSRTVTMIWNPCCDNEPMGGVCIHQSTITDNQPPSTPENLEAEI